MQSTQSINDEMGSDDVNRSNVAYAKALRRLHDHPVTAILAKKIIDVDTSGADDPEELADVNPNSLPQHALAHKSI